MHKTAFHYEIHADAGLAHDTKTGENAPAYVKIEFELNRELTTAEYKQVHEIEAIDYLVEKKRLKAEHLKPVSEEEFLKVQGKGEIK